MLSPESNKYLDEILSYVKFGYDRNKIRKELTDHMVDSTEYYINQGYSDLDAEQMALDHMGEAEEIGMELNKEHNPFIGWIWRITKIISGLMIVFTILIVAIFVGSIEPFKEALIDEIPKSEISYQMDVNEKVKIDDTVIIITKLVYTKKSEMIVFYHAYQSNFRMGMRSFYLGKFYDENGTQYMSGSGNEDGGIINRGYWCINDFPTGAKQLIISYDLYGRYYKIEIPLKAGEKNESKEKDIN